MGWSIFEISFILLLERMILLNVGRVLVGPEEYGLSILAFMQKHKYMDKMSFINYITCKSEYSFVCIKIMPCSVPIWGQVTKS